MVTEKCNTNCIYCYAKRDNRQEMTTQEIITVLKKLSLSGVINVTLTGGDLFARKDWYDIISASREFGFGYLISTKTILEEKDIIKLKQEKVDQIQFSLDSVSPEILREMINVSSNYADNLKRMFKLCHKHNLNISLRTVLCKQNANIEQMKLLCDFVDSNLCIVSWVITPAFYSENKRNYEKYAASNAMLRDVISYLQRRQMRIRPLFNKLDKNGYTLKRTKNVESFVEDNQICYANTFSVSILPTGDCTICEMLYYNKYFIVGNIRDMRIEEIWNSNKALNLYSPSKDKTSRDSACSSCAVFDMCKSNIAKRICYVDVVKVYKRSDFPDPKCPASTTCHYVL